MEKKSPGIMARASGSPSRGERLWEYLVWPLSQTFKPHCANKPAPTAELFADLENLDVPNDLPRFGGSYR